MVSDQRRSKNTSFGQNNRSSTLSEKPRVADAELGGTVGVCPSSDQKRLREMIA